MSFPIETIVYTRAMNWRTEIAKPTATATDFVDRIKSGLLDTYEVTSDGMNRLYFDIDGAVDCDNYSADIANQITIEGKTCLMHILEEFGIEAPNIAIATAHSASFVCNKTKKEKAKYSVRYFVDTLATKDDIKYIADCANKMCKDENSTLFQLLGNIEPFDMGIYDKNRKMRCVNTSKPGENRPLVMFEGDIKDTVITGFHTGLESIDIGREEESEAVAMAYPEEVRVSRENATEVELYVRAGLETGMSTKLNGYPVRQTLAFILHDAMGDNGEGLFVEWYRGRASFTEAGARAKYKAFASATKPVKKVGIGTLIKMYKDTNLTLATKIIRTVKSAVIATKKHSDITEEAVNSGELSYENVKQYFEETLGVCKIVRLQVYVVGTDKQKEDFDSINEPYTIMKEKGLISAFRHLQCMVAKTEYNKRGEPTTRQVACKFITKYIDDNTIKCYDTIECCPPPEVCPAHVYNCWTPFRAESIVDFTEKPEALEALRAHIKILCGNDDAVAIYFEKWIAQMLQYPASKSIFPTFISTEGAGKGTLLRLLRGMMGKSKVLETTAPSRDCWGSFNSLMQSAFLINLNELSDKETVFAEGIIKGLITDDMININKKGIDPFKMRSCHRHLGSTNQSDPVTTKRGDRRNMVIRSSDEKCGDKKYFTHLYSLINDDDVIGTVYQYFMNIPDMDKFGELDVPITAYQLDMQESNTCPIELFVKHMVQQSETQTDVLPGSELYTEYKCWAHQTGIPSLSDVKFGVRLGRLSIAGFCKKRASSGTKWELNYALMARSLNIEIMPKTNVVEGDAVPKNMN